MEGFNPSGMTLRCARLAGHRDPTQAPSCLGRPAPLEASAQTRILMYQYQKAAPTIPA